MREYIFRLSHFVCCFIFIKPFIEEYFAVFCARLIRFYKIDMSVRKDNVGSNSLITIHHLSQINKLSNFDIGLVKGKMPFCYYILRNRKIKNPQFRTHQNGMHQKNKSHLTRQIDRASINLTQVSTTLMVNRDNWIPY